MRKGVGSLHQFLHQFDAELPSPGATAWVGEPTGTTLRTVPHRSKSRVEVERRARPSAVGPVHHPWRARAATLALTRSSTMRSRCVARMRTSTVFSAESPTSRWRVGLL